MKTHDLLTAIFTEVIAYAPVNDNNIILPWQLQTYAANQGVTIYLVYAAKTFFLQLFSALKVNYIILCSNHIFLITKFNKKTEYESCFSDLCKLFTRYLL